MTVKAKRLAKVAKELNVGTNTIFEFLDSEKIEIEKSPNTKLTPDVYERLLEKFQPDMLVKQKKEEAKLQADRDREEFLKHEIRPKDKPAPAKREKEEETVLIKSNVIEQKKEESAAPVVEEKAAKEAPAPVVEEKVEPEPTKEPVKEEPQVVAEVEVPKEEPAATEEKVAEPVKPEPESEKKEEPKEEGGLKVLGKIDLESIAKKPKKTAAKKTKKEEKPEAVVKEDTPKETPAEAAPKEEPVESKEVVAEADAAVAADQSSTEPAEGTEGESEVEAPTSRGEVDLKGLTVVGKIDVEQFKKKPKPVASSTDNDSLRKKKRKRKKIEPAGGTPQRSNTGGPGQGRPGGPGQGRPGGPGQGRSGPGGRPGGPGQGRPGGPGQGPNRRRRTDKVELDDKQVQQQIKETLNRLTNKDSKRGSKAKLKKKKRDLHKQRAEEEELERDAASRVLEVTEFITANELANLMDVTVAEVITACMSLGLMVSINQRIDAETIQVVADEFGYEVEFKDVEMDEPSLEEEDEEAQLVERAPIVTIMGHVDHGKTSLLDHIRKSNVIAGEAGGITQHIGAYEVELDSGKNITFLDTPGHEAFTAMRARGAQVTDLAIIIIAADDRVMPQTKEAISHAQAADVPMIFAINKVDREASNADNIRQQLADMNILVEEWGGKYQCQEISAKTGLNIDDLLEKVLLEAELLELKADPEKRAVGTVIEAWLDKGRGIVATVLVQGGTMEVGDVILAGAHSGRVKAMSNERGQRVKTAGPSTPVQILGFTGAPAAGDKVYVTKSEAEAREIANQRQQLIREQGIRATKHVTLDEIGRRIAVGNFKELNVIVKGDVDGSVEALSDSLLKQSTEEIQVNVIHKGVGQISESDVLLASASDAIVIGFQVRPSANARSLAEKEQIDIRLYSVIYQAIDEVKQAMEGLLEPTTEEKVVATVEVRETFKISKVGTIAGCMVTTGKVNRNSNIRLVREGVVKFEGKLASLKRFKDDVKEVAKGYECGLNLEGFNDIQVEDYLEAYEVVEVKRKLS